MRIVVCVKQVLDPEIPARAFRIDSSGRQPAVVGMPAARVPDSFAENALELGVQIRDRVAGSTLTAIAVGDETSDDALRRAFALTADAGVRAWDPSWAEVDALAISHVIARVIATIGGADLVLCGRQASDIEEGVLGPALAEELGAPCITAATRIDVTPTGLSIERGADGIVQIVESPLPAVATIASAATNVPRMAKVKDVMMAKRKAIKRMGAADLALDPDAIAPGFRIERLALPESDGVCEMIAGSDVGALAIALADWLRELRLV
jgi:electron transfer flavoprotein beta subunit